MQHLAILQSGYVLPLNDRVFLPEETQPDITQAIIKPYKNIHGNLYFAKHFYTVIQEFNFHNTVLKNFDFRHRFLQELFLTFNTLSFKQWVYLQLQSPMLNNLNVRFLIDTFNFILGGEREFEASNWLSLIEASNGNIEKDKADHLFQCYFGDYRDHNLYDGPILPAGITDVVALWTARPGGFKDLISTMDVIFGDKRKVSITSTGQLAGSTDTGFLPDVAFNNNA